MRPLNKLVCRLASFRKNDFASRIKSGQEPKVGSDQEWPILRRLCAVADYLQPEFPDSLLPAFIRRSPCNSVDELHIIQ